MTLARPRITLLLLLCNGRAEREMSAGVCLLCESLAAAPCQKVTSLHPDLEAVAPPLFSVGRKTDGARGLDRYLTCPVSPDPPRWLFMQIQDLGEAGEFITHRA